MSPKAITAPFRWWAKHPWMAFGLITLLGLFSNIIYQTFAYPIDFLVLVMAWILSWCRGVFVTWQRSKVRAVMAFAAFPITILLINQMMFVHHPHYNYDSDVKSNLKNAATAQEAYFVDHDTYTSNIDSLKEVGYRQSYNVIMGASATTITFVITGTATGCEPDTGTWSINSTTGEIDGTPCHYSDGTYRRRFYDKIVRANLENAAKAEEAYYKDNGTYTASIGNLKGFKQGDNVTISASATANTFVITGTMTEGCKANTGTWSYISTTGAINGTPCSRP